MSGFVASNVVTDESINRGYTVCTLLQYTVQHSEIVGVSVPVDVKRLDGVFIVYRGFSCTEEAQRQITG